MTEPLISVIIPAYNCAEYIEHAMNSALSQNTALEVLVIDDCSTDDLEQVMQPYLSHSEVRFIKNDHNIGAAATRNKGVNLAKGKYIAFLDADDIWAPGKLAKQLKVMEESGTVLCATARELMDPEGHCTGKVIPVDEIIRYKDLLKHNSINCSSVLLLKSVAMEFPMHHEDSHEDYIMWLEILSKYGEARGINEPLLKYRLSSTGKSGSKLQSAKMTYMAYRYVGFGVVKSMLCFGSYVYNGIKKYFF